MSIQIKRQGVLFVVSAPSGGGKSTVLKALRTDDAGLGYSISATTRPPRYYEEHGKDYFFYTESEFEELVRKRAFYEWAPVHGHRYGTLRSVVDAELEAGRDVLLDIDVQGGLNIKRTREDAVLVFLLPPSMQVLEDRLRGRKSDSEESIQLRLQNARNELAFILHYDYAIVNNDIKQTVRQVRSIVEAERTRTSRLRITTEGEDVRLTPDLFTPRSSE